MQFVINMYKQLKQDYKDKHLDNEESYVMDLIKYEIDMYRREHGKLDKTVSNMDHLAQKTDVWEKKDIAKERMQKQL